MRAPIIYRSGNQIVAENVRILPGGFLNFSGRETRNKVTGQIYNHDGQRNFWFEVPEDFFDIFIDESINLKITENSMPVADDEERKGRVKVNVKIDSGRVPKVYTRVGVKDENGEFITKFKEITNLKTISLLDEEFYEMADLVMNISRKNPTQHSLYLVSGAFTFKNIVDPIQQKYEGMIDKPDNNGYAESPTDDEEELPFR